MCPNGNADLTRSLILNSAIKVISDNGLSALTAGRLIEQAGISKGGLYHHFRTMQDVEREVLERLIQNLLLKVSSYGNPDTKSDFLDLVEQELFECFISNDEACRALYAFVSESVHDRKIQVMMQQMMDELSMRRLEQLLSICPGVAHITLNNIVQIILTTQMGLMTRFFIAGDKVSLRNYWRGCRSLLEELLGLAQNAAIEDSISEMSFMDKMRGVSQI